MNIFEYPEIFLLLLLPFIVYYLLPKKNKVEQQNIYALRLPFFQRVAPFVKPLATNEANLKSKIFVSLAWLFLITAAAKPVWYLQENKMPLKARNIVLSLDVSDSMKEEDFFMGNNPIPRLMIVKKVVTDFFEKRKDDNIGLVLFGDEAYTYAPLSYDKKTLKTLLDEIGFGMAGSRTAMGDGLALAIQTALKVKAESRIVILLSDGYTNAGRVGLDEAVEIAQKNNVKVYSIGLGGAPIEQQVFGFSVPVETTFDEKSLQYVADQTGGKYFKASTTKDLEGIYNTIDALEKEDGKEKSLQPKRDLFFIPLAISMLFLFFAIINRRGL